MALLLPLPLWGQLIHGPLAPSNSEGNSAWKWGTHIYYMQTFGKPALLPAYKIVRTYNENDLPETEMRVYYDRERTAYDQYKSVLSHVVKERYEYHWNKLPRVIHRETSEDSINYEYSRWTIEYDPICVNEAVRAYDEKGNLVNNYRVVTRDAQNRIVKMEYWDKEYNKDVLTQSYYYTIHYPNETTLEADSIAYYDVRNGEECLYVNLEWKNTDGQVWEAYDDYGTYAVWPFGQPRSPSNPEGGSENRVKSFDMLVDKDKDGMWLRKLHVENEYLDDGGYVQKTHDYTYKNVWGKLGISAYEFRTCREEYIDEYGSYCLRKDEYTDKNLDGTFSDDEKEGSTSYNINDEHGNLVNKYICDIKYPSEEEIRNPAIGYEIVYTYDENGQIIRAERYELMYDTRFIGALDEYSGYRELVTGIGSAAETKSNSRIYDLFGRKRDKLQPGLNIVGGKKVFVPRK